MTDRPVLVAPDSFKGTFRATEVAAAIGRGLESAGLRPPDLCPVADGGDGTMEVLLTALGGETAAARVHDPLGREVEAGYALIEDGGTAVIEMARASGLALVAPDERDAVAASTRGTGELIAAAVADGAAVVLVACGGSATTDGAAGAIEAIEEAGGLGGARIVCICDVRTPFERAAEVFGPQKGADPATVKRLTKRLNDFAQTLPRDPRGEPMTGCAGGLSGGLWAQYGAALEPGAAFVLERAGLRRAHARGARRHRRRGPDRRADAAGQDRRRDRDARAPGRRAVLRDRRHERARRLRRAHARPAARARGDRPRRHRGRGRFTGRRPLISTIVAVARWTLAVIRHRKAIIAAWIALFVVGGAAAANLGGLLSNRFSVPGSDAERGLDLLKDRMNERSDGAFTLVVAGPGAVRRTAPRWRAAAQRGARADRRRHARAPSSRRARPSPTSRSRRRSRTRTPSKETPKVRDAIGDRARRQDVPTGYPALNHDTQPIYNNDLARGESIAVPIAAPRDGLHVRDARRHRRAARCSR